MLWSQNSEYGLKDLETKLSLFIFPIIYYSSDKLTKQKLLAIFTAFVYGCMAASVICLGNAVYQYFHTQYLLANNIWAWDYEIDFFLKDRLSFLIHPSYISMYFIMALVMLHWLRSETEASSPWRKYIIPFTFSFFILLFSSKAGIVSLLIWGIYIGWYYIFRERRLKLLVIGAVSVACAFLALYFSPSQFPLRFKGTIHTLTEDTNVKNSTESTAIRIAIWKAAKQVITQNPLTGIGTGDAKDELLNEYEKQGITFALTEKLNAHNQFLQTAVALGIPGVLLLCTGLFLPLFAEWKKKNYVFIVFILLITVNFAAESMLETQAGVVFYAFFNSLFLFSQKENL